MNDEQKEMLVVNMAHNLPTLRTKAGLTQAKLAEMVGISRQTLVAVESGKRLMSWNTFLACILVFQKNPETNKLLNIFDISTEELSDYLEITVKNGGKVYGI